MEKVQPKRSKIQNKIGKMNTRLPTMTVDQRMELFKKYLDFSKMDHKSYQYEGVRWCLQNELCLHDTSVSGTSVRGGFIADEMGLGKTILMIGTFIAHFVPKTLVVVPPVLLDQWYKQIYKTTGHRSLIYHGPHRWSLNLGSAIIVLTTYDMIASPKKSENKGGKKRENLLYSIPWDRIVFDEGHHLRNQKTLIYSGAMRLKSKIRWIVSGTPIQNKKQDFYHLCDVIGIPPRFYKDPESFSLMARHYILKRTKKQVGIDMKEVLLNRELVDWENPREKELSQAIHSYLSFSQASPASPLDSRFRIFSPDTILNHLVMILKARQCCILPKMVLHKNNNKNVSSVSDTASEEKLMKEALSSTSKLNSVVGKILERKDNGNGKLIFCHFKEEIDELARRLFKEGFKNVCILDGRLSQNRRKEILASGCEVLILQIQTGCEGLNLQEHYSEIYFVSPHWNPAVEDQAVARCHRIGQKKQVEVHKFSMSSFSDLEQKSESFSLDGYVTSVQDKKRDVANEVFA